jgi:hypothetical protein
MALLSTLILLHLPIPQTVRLFVIVSLKSLDHTYEAATDHSPVCATHDVEYGVWTRTPDTHGVLYYGTCVFEAGTRNIVDSLWIGSTNIADITRAALNRWQVCSFFLDLSCAFLC